MSVLRLNGINLGAIMAAQEEPKGERRDIGNEAQATNGSMRVTIVARKKDMKFRTIPLSEEDAEAWDSLISGEGEVWSFDSHLYGSKGLGPSANVGCTVTAGSAKFGAAKLNVQATTGSITFTAAAFNSYGRASIWTVMAWRSINGGTTWTHYAIRSDGAKWVNGVRDDAANTSFISVSNGAVTISNTDGTARQYDDLVVLPYLIHTSWPAQLQSAAFSPLPFLNLDGDMVKEQATRVVKGSVSDSSVKLAQGYKKKLEVQFKAR